MRRILLAAMLLLISGTAHAAGVAAPQPTGQEATRIETDQKTGTVRIIIDNREVARFERDGLHVRDSVAYGGLITDTGVAGYARAEPKH